MEPPTPAPQATQLFREAAESPAVVRAQLGANGPAVAVLAERLRRDPPRAVTTLGRGSSDNAATYARYLIETRLGVMTASAPPSVSALYSAAPQQPGTLCLVISQSGRSPDVLAAARAAAEAGALVVALVNDTASPLAELTSVVLPLLAGSELSVAASKTCIASMSLVAQLVARWSGDGPLIRAVERLPDLLERAWSLDWSAAVPILKDAQSLYVVGRGVGFGIAEEMALKLKETCGLHAEAFSAAEVRHGPMALVGAAFPIIAICQDDETRGSVEALAAAAAAQGAPVIKIGGDPAAGALSLPTVRACPSLEPIAFALSFYRLAVDLALARGFDPDRPPHLAKVTETR
jgi:glucosamine--fructose-6-phosphate aminotransferase (isomerizing)